MRLRTAFLLGLAWLVGSITYTAVILALAWPDPEPPIIDVHLNYHRDAWNRFQPNKIVQTLEHLQVTHAVVSSSPNEGTLILLRQAGARVIPMLSLEEDGIAWLENEHLLAQLRREVARADYRGVGKVAIPTSGRESKAVDRLVDFAVQRALVLYVDADAKTIAHLFEIDPKVRVLWAHGGVATAPEAIGGLLERFANLYVDLSLRTDIAPNRNDVAPAWLALFKRYPSRFMLGSGTSNNDLWQRFHYTLIGQRRWLQGLPPPLAEHIASKNAAALFIPDLAPVSSSAIPSPHCPPATCSAAVRAAERCPLPNEQRAAGREFLCLRDRRSS